MYKISRLSDTKNCFYECYKRCCNPVGKKTSARCLKDVLRRHLTKTSCRCPKDVLKANLKDIFVRHLEETLARYIVDVLQKTS